MPLLETPRLTLSEIAISDASFIYDLLNSPTWIKYIGDRNITDLDAAKAYIQKAALDSYATHGYGPYKMVLKDSHTPIGMCGFFKRPSLEHPDLGYAILPQYEGKGYTTEAAIACVDFAKNTLKIPALFAFTSEENVGSRRLLEKVGMQITKPMDWEGEEVVVYRIGLVE